MKIKDEYRGTQLICAGSNVVLVVNDIQENQYEYYSKKFPWLFENEVIQPVENPLKNQSELGLQDNKTKKEKK